MRNPFSRSTGMLPEVFVGRERELKELRRAFENAKSGKSEQTILYGSFGIGKTSILIKFKQEIKEKARVVRVPLYVTDNITEICDLILRESRSQLHLKTAKLVEKLEGLGFSFLGVSANLTLAKIEMNPQSALKNIFETIYDVGLKKKPVVILMDDLHRICGKGNEKSRMILSIFSNVLMQLNQEGKNIMFIGTGSYDIFQSIRDHDESSVRIFHPIEIQPLSSEQTRDALLLSLKPIKVKVTNEVITRIFQTSEGIPYYVQILGFYCFEEREKNTITLDSFSSGYDMALTDLAEKEFIGMYKQLSNIGGKIVGYIAEHQNPEVNYGEIKEFIGSEISNYLNELMEKGIVIKKGRGKYCIRDHMLREYLRNFKPYERG